MRLAASFRYFLLAMLTVCLGQSLTAQTAVSIHDIMVVSPGIPGYTSYFLPDSYYLYSHYGQPVSVTGVVVGVEQSGDFAGSVYISEFSSNSTLCSTNSNYCWDSYQASAEGMPVFGLASVNSACAVVGATITVVGNVVESNSIVPADITAANTPGTGLPTGSSRRLFPSELRTISMVRWTCGSSVHPFYFPYHHVGITAASLT